MRGIDYKSLYEDLAMRIDIIADLALEVAWEELGRIDKLPDLARLVDLACDAAGDTRRDYYEEKMIERKVNQRPDLYPEEVREEE